MIAYKGFDPGLKCRGYQFVMGQNITPKANCRKNGFHCAEDPLDCLTYYPHIEHSEYYIVDAGGDIDETEGDTKIACTKLMILKRLSVRELFLHALAYMVAYPKRSWSCQVKKEYGRAMNGYTVVRGKMPRACGSKIGDYLAMAKESTDGGKIVQISLAYVDGEKIMPNMDYNIDFTRKVA